MYKVKIALYFVTIAIFLIVRIAIQKDKAHSKIYTGLFLLGVATTIVFVGIQLFTWDDCTISEILFFATPTVAIFSLEYDKHYVELENVKPTIICIIATVISFLIAILVYFGNFEVCETPEIETTSYVVVYDNQNITENQLYFKGTNDDETQYYYYYLEEDEILPLTIEADSIEKVITDKNEKPYLEKIVTTTYQMNHNNKPATKEIYKKETTYKLYVPQGTLNHLL